MLDFQCAGPHQSGDQDHTKLTTLSRQTALHEQSVKLESELPSEPRSQIGRGFFLPAPAMVAYENNDR